MSLEDFERSLFDTEGYPSLDFLLKRVSNNLSEIKKMTSLSLRGQNAAWVPALTTLR